MRCVFLPKKSPERKKTARQSCFRVIWVNIPRCILDSRAGNTESMTLLDEWVCIDLSFSLWLPDTMFWSRPDPERKVNKKQCRDTVGATSLCKVTVSNSGGLGSKAFMQETISPLQWFKGVCCTPCHVCGLFERKNSLFEIWSKVWSLTVKLNKISICQTRHGLNRLFYKQQNRITRQKASIDSKSCYNGQKSMEIYLYRHDVCQSVFKQDFILHAKIQCENKKNHLPDFHLLFCAHECFLRIVLLRRPLFSMGAKIIWDLRIKNVRSVPQEVQCLLLPREQV